jgi:hypothetical protein
MDKNTRLKESGVSEAIGFMLIFGMVIVGIGLVTLYGYPLLLKQQVGADEKIMEKNMIVLQNDVKSLAYKTVPFKETALKIGGGSLTVYNSSYSTPSSTIEINDNGNNPYIPPFTPGELRYESMSAQTDISLQDGAVVLRRHVEPGSVMLAEPRWFFDRTTNTIVINLIKITSDTIVSKEGIGTVQMRLVGEPSYIPAPPIPKGQAINLVYKPAPSGGGQDYSVAWDNYITKIFDDPPYITMTPSGPPGSGAAVTYTLTNKGYILTNNGPVDIAADMTLVIKIFEVNIKSL